MMWFIREASETRERLRELVKSQKLMTLQARVSMSVIAIFVDDSY